MKFYVIEVSEGDSKIAGKGMYEYDTLEEAVANFHSKLGTAMKSDLYDSDLVMVVNSEGGTYPKYTEKYLKPQSELVEEIADESVEEVVE